MRRLFISSILNHRLGCYLELHSLPKHNKPLLQVALDLTDLRKALDIAAKAYDAGASILEAGTPLIKSAGMKSISELRHEFPGAIIVADMKTMDTGYLEATMAYEAGADITTVLAVADDDTIKGALKAAKEHNKWVEADLINHPDPIGRAKELAHMGVHIAGFHIGIDTQKRLGMTATELIDVIKNLITSIDIKVSVAGGIKPEGVRTLCDIGVWKIVVGSAITKAKDPGKVTKEIIEILETC